MTHALQSRGRPGQGPGICRQGQAPTCPRAASTLEAVGCGGSGGASTDGRCRRRVVVRGPALCGPLDDGREPAEVLPEASPRPPEPMALEVR